MTQALFLLPAALLAAGVLAAPARAAAPPVLFSGTYTYVGETENKDGDGAKTRRNDLQLKARVPIPLGPGLLLVGASYDGQYVSYSDVPDRFDSGDLPHWLHALGVTVGYSWSLWEEWRAVATAGVGIHSDFKDVTGKDVVPSVSFLATRKFGNKGQNEWGLGLGYSDALGQKKVFPLLALTWSFTESVYLDALLPERLDFGYRMAPELKVGLEGRLKGYQYRLTDDSPWDNGVISFREVRLGPFAEYAFSKAGSVRASAGLVTAQKFEFRDEDGDKLQDGDMKNTGYVSVVLNLTF